MANVRVSPYIRKGDRGFEQVGGYQQRRDDMSPGNVGEGLRRRAATAQRKQTGVSGGTPPAPKAPGAPPSQKGPPKAPGGPGAPQAPPPVLQYGKGTADDPIVTGDVTEAAKALGEGKHVRLKQRRQVSTLLTKLAEMVKDASAKGEQAPNYDLCKVTVKNTNLFCVDNKGIPRVEMPQLVGTPDPGSPAEKFPKNDKGEVDLGEEFAKFLVAQGHAVTDGKIDASLLRATQTELNGANVAKIAKSISENGFNATNPTWVSNDDYILDGHHRWAAVVGVSAGSGQPIQLPVRQVDLDIITILDLAKRWTKRMGIAPKSAKTALSRLRGYLDRREYRRMDRRMEKLLADLMVVELARRTIKVSPYLRKQHGKVEQVSGYVREEEVIAAALWARERAKQEEPDTTETLQGLATKYGGTMTGLDFRLKTAKSLRRKIRDRAGDRGQPPDEVAQELSDALRYTFMFGDGDYAAGAKGVIADLESQGWFVRAKNWWAPGDPYDGLNIALGKPDGYPIEVQFHTPQSFISKETLIHPLYERFRVSKDNAERRALYNQMSAIAASVHRPEGIEGLPWEPMFQPYEDLPPIAVV